MLISICIPCHNRTYDLKETLPITVKAANASPPVEICVLNYNSPDDLHEYMMKQIRDLRMTPGNQITYRVYTGHNYFYQSHAFNLAVMMGHGEYCVLMGTDAYPDTAYIQELRSLISTRCTFMRASNLCGIVCFRKKEFVEIGGYDERFEFYGPEDRDLENRMVRKGVKFGLVPSGLMHVIETPNSEKIKNYRLKLSKREMSKISRSVLDENDSKGVIVVNPNGWGSWE